MKSITIKNLVSALLLLCVFVLLVSCGEEGGTGTDPDAVPKPAPQLIGLEPTGASLHPLLVWRPTGTPADSVVYNLYFGQTDPPRLLAGSLTDTSYQSAPLMPNAKYYWLIEAKYNGGSVGRSAVSSFTTRTGITFPMAVGNQWEYRREVVVIDTLVSYYLIRVASTAPSWPQQPAYAVSEHWASLNPVRSDTAVNYYQQTDSGLYRLGTVGTGSAIPASTTEGMLCRFQGQEYSSIDELFQFVRETRAVTGGTRPGSIASDQPVLGLRYPLAVGEKWTVYESSPWPLDKEVSGYSLVTVPGGTFGCFEVRWLHDMDNNGTYDDNIEFDDYFAEEGLVKRTIFLDDVAVYDPLGNLIGVVDATETYELVAYKLVE
jgi:hypothetical protein